MRYPLYFRTDTHTVSFGNTPLYISAAPYPFISNGHSCKGGFSALFQGRLRPFSFTSSFPHFSCRIETAISIRRTRLLPDLRPIVFSTMQRIWLLNGISFLPLQPQTADTLSRLMFFPPTCRNGSGLVSVDGQVFHVSESAADCFASTFSRPLSI